MAAVTRSRLGRAATELGIVVSRQTVAAIGGNYAAAEDGATSWFRATGGSAR